MLYKFLSELQILGMTYMVEFKKSPKYLDRSEACLVPGDTNVMNVHQGKHIVDLIESWRYDSYSGLFSYIEEHCYP